MPSDKAVTNAIIENAKILIPERPPVLCLSLNFRYGVYGQGATIPISGNDLLFNLMSMLDIQHFENLTGCPVRIVHTDTGVIAIRHFHKDLSFNLP